MTIIRAQGNLFYGTAPNPASTNANVQVTSIRDSWSPDLLRVPATMTAQPYDIPAGQTGSLTIDFLDDGDAAGAGGFFEFLAVQSATGAIIYLAWQPTGASAPSAEYKARAVRASRTAPSQGLIQSTVTLPVETVTDSFVT